MIVGVCCNIQRIKFIYKLGDGRCRNNIFIIPIELIDGLHLNQNFHLQNQPCVWSYKPRPPFSYVYLISHVDWSHFVIASTAVGIHSLMIMPSTYLEVCLKIIYLFFFLLDLFISLAVHHHRYSSFSVSSSYSFIHT